jgi:hypothetical protein
MAAYILRSTTTTQMFERNRERVAKRALYMACTVKYDAYSEL